MSDLLNNLFLTNTPLLDVRAPVEFNKGTLPNAHNIPLLDDQQRHQVGITYKNEGQQRAIELGEKLLHPALRQQRILQWRNFVSDNPGAHLFCFRGGLRSKTTRRWLAESGVDLPLVPGGYKACRQYLQQQLAAQCKQSNFTLLGGRTGCGKTLLLKKLPAYIDLEGLANHRGSSFGATTTPQPGNIDFENAVAVALMKFHAANTMHITLEDEGRMIGSVALPQPLRDSMLQAPIVLLEEPVAVRVNVSRQAYIDELLSAYEKLDPTNGLPAFADHHRNALEKITRRFGGQQTSETRELFDLALRHYERSGDTAAFEPYVETLLVKYYDPMYDYQLAKKMNRVVFTGDSKAVLDWYQSKGN